MQARGWNVHLIVAPFLGMALYDMVHLVAALPCANDTSNRDVDPSSIASAV